MITLASDFGTPYPAAMRGVIARRTDARVDDISHDLPRQDVRTAAFWLSFVLPEFPPAVHCAVVDPGVGTDRNAIVVRAGDHALVGPDNGSLMPPARELADGDPEAFAATVGDPASSTFHGRDVFAPLAADVHETGVDAVESLDGLAPTDPVDCRLPTPDVDDASARGAVLAVDDFGNAITNVPGETLAGVDRVTVNGTPAPVVETFAAVDPGERLVTVGSHGNVECDVNRGRGDEAFGLAVGASVTVEFG